MGYAGASLTNAVAPGIGTAVVWAVGATLPQQYNVSIQASNDPQFVLRLEGYNFGSGAWSPIAYYTSPGDKILQSISSPSRGGAQTAPVGYTKIQANLLSINPNPAMATATFTGSVAGTTLTVDSFTVVGTIAVGNYISAPTLIPGTKITAGSGLSWTVTPSQTMSDGAIFSYSVQPSLSVQIGGGP